MNKKEMFAKQEQLYNIYTGILRNNTEFADGTDPLFHYEFDCPEYAELREKYNLEKIAGKGSDFERTMRLVHHFAPRLKHKGDYDGHVTPNALTLLDYCYEKEDVGINCLYKSKILAECCMALGIYARRVHIMPYSPYDFDNHVDTEIFDRKRNKWIVVDVTNDCYYIDENKTPLNIMEIRSLMLNQQTCTCVFPRQSIQDPEAVSQRLNNISLNAYTAKNMFWFKIDEYSSFGIKGIQYHFLPKYFDVKNHNITGYHFRIQNMDKYGLDPALKDLLREIIKKEEAETPTICNPLHAWDSPIQ